MFQYIYTIFHCILAHINHAGTHLFVVFELDLALPVLGLAVLVELGVHLCMYVYVYIWRIGIEKIV